MIPKLEQEIWISRFAAKMMEVQPRFPERLAVEIAADVWPHLGVLPPDQAVATVIDWAAGQTGPGLPSVRAQSSAA